MSAFVLFWHPDVNYGWTEQRCWGAHSHPQLHMKNKWVFWWERAHTQTLFIWIHISLKSMCRSTCHRDTFSVYLAHVLQELEIIGSKGNSELGHCRANFLYHPCPYHSRFWLWAGVGQMMAVSLMVLFGHLVAVQTFGSITQTLKLLFQNMDFLLFMFMVSWK